MILVNGFTNSHLAIFIKLLEIPSTPELDLFFKCSITCEILFSSIDRKANCVASLQKGPHVAIYQSRENRS